VKHKSGLASWRGSDQFDRPGASDGVPSRAFPAARAQYEYHPRLLRVARSIHATVASLYTGGHDSSLVAHPAVPSIRNSQVGCSIVSAIRGGREGSCAFCCTVRRNLTLSRRAMKARSATRSPTRFPSDYKTVSTAA